MRKTVLFSLIIFFFRIPGTVAQDVQNGNLYTLITQIKNAMLGKDSYGFVIPEEAQQDSFSIVIDSLLAHNYAAATSRANVHGYKLLEWYDTAYENRRYYILMETSGNQLGGVVTGWGTYLFYPEGSDRLIIEVPHPLHDINTWRVGFNLFQQLDFKFMLMAGTHRYANGSDTATADVAHNTATMFHTVHQKVSPHAQYSFQVHGFSNSEYPDIVLSNGTPSPYSVIDTLATELTSNGFSVGVYNGIDYSAYGATTNTQGKWSRAHGYAFIHMELQRFIRDSESEWGKVINAIEQAFFILPTTISHDIVQPSRYIHLFHSYPNPFNPVTNFRFFLSETETIRLKIYNISGQLVLNLYNGVLPSGNHIFQWDGRDQDNNRVASGMYILKLESPLQQQFQKIYLVK